MKIKPIKVTLLNQYIKKVIKSNGIFHNLYVEGEVSNVRISKTGYTYFTISDEASSINCICFYVDNSLVDGDKIIVNGELSVYEAKGTYQIVVNSIEKVGIGNIFKELEDLKNRLKAQGLFEKASQVPLLPTKIGIVTSKSGAALQDILKTLNTLNCGFDINIYNSLVQGDGAVQTIIDGIEYFNKLNNIDAIVLARGGGSYEDLKIFNSVKIAECMYMSKIPIVTGIGHETDITLADYVADVHCHTPTAAAEYLIRGYKNINIELESLYRNLVNVVKSNINKTESKLQTYKFMLKANNPINYLDKTIDRCNMLNKLLEKTYIMKINNLSNQLDVMYTKLIQHDYKKMLDNGYSLILDENNNLISKKDQINVNQNIKILSKEFTAKANILELKEVEYGE